MCITQRLILIAVLLTTTIYGFAQPAEVKLAYEYYRQGEVEKARTIYDKLARNSKNVGYIHEVYVNLLVEMQDYKAAEKYLDRVIALIKDGCCCEPAGKRPPGCSLMP